MGSVDKLQTAAVTMKADKMKKGQMRKKKHEAKVEKLLKKVALEDTSDSSSVSSGSSAALLQQKAHGEGRPRTQ